MNIMELQLNEGSSFDRPVRSRAVRPPDIGPATPFCPFCSKVMASMGATHFVCPSGHQLKKLVPDGE